MGYRPPHQPVAPGPSVVHLTTEYWPWARTGGLAEAVRGLCTALTDAGIGTTVLLPLYREVRRAGAVLEPVGKPFTVRVGARDEPGRLFRLLAPAHEPRVYFVEHSEYFDRPAIYGEHGTDYADNARRFSFFTAAALSVIGEVAPGATVLHLHDWHTALAPLLQTLETPDSGGGRSPTRRKTVLTVHNAAFQGRFSADSRLDLGLPETAAGRIVTEPDGGINWLRTGLRFADVVTTVSHTHAAELTTEMGGFGLHPDFRELGDRLVGITNGIDTVQWDPTLDQLIPARFTARSLDGKRRCKAALHVAYRLTAQPDTPLVGMSARLVGQKGLPIILESLPVLARQAQFIFLGRGEPQFEQALGELSAQWPGRIAVDLDFNDAAEHRLLAGADILLLPSLYEPCGLTQMRAQHYGALPVARRVGGLADTVVDDVTGFLFDDYSAPALEDAMARAVAAYRAPLAWRRRVRAAMARDFSWDPSVSAYLRVYGIDATPARPVPRGWPRAREATVAGA